MASFFACVVTLELSLSLVIITMATVTTTDKIHATIMTSGGIDRDLPWPLSFLSPSWSWSWGSCPSAASFKVDWAASAETSRATLRACGGAAGGAAGGARRRGTGERERAPTARTGASGVTEGKYCRGGTGGGSGCRRRTGGGRRPAAESATAPAAGGAATGGAATGACVNVSALADGDPPESLTDGSSGASFETQKRPWQRGQLA